MVDEKMVGWVFFPKETSTSLLKTFDIFFESEILSIVKYSLASVFPNAFKMAVVRPLLNKNNLDPNVMDNYWPFSNLFF